LADNFFEAVDDVFCIRTTENEKSPASVNLQGFSARLTISLSPRTSRGFFILSLASGLDTTTNHQKILIG
jgi:hypothetical protein